MSMNLKAAEVNDEILSVLAEAQLDITGAAMVEVSWRGDRTVLWVSVNGVTVLRVCRIAELKIADR